MDPLSPDGKPTQKGNLFDYDDKFESQVTSDEYLDVSAKYFRASSMGKQMKDRFTVQEAESGLTIGSPIVQTEEPEKIEITATKSVKFSATEKPPKISVEPDKAESEIQPSDVIRDLILGNHTWIGRFRKLSQKHELLNLALDTHDQNTIFAILLHLKQTLAEEVLLQTLNKYPKSKFPYYTLLQQEGLDQEVIAVTHACGDYEKSGQLRLKQASKQGDPYKQLLMMKDCVHYFKKIGMNKIADFVADECELLDAQLSIHTFEKSTGRIQEGVGSVEIFSPVLKTPNYTTLYYLCLHHFDSNIGLSSPKAFCDKFNIPDSHFVWIALSARAQLKDWLCVDGLIKKYQTKSWFGAGKGTSFLIVPERVVEIFHQKDDTPWGEGDSELRNNLILSHLNLIEDLEERYLWAFRFLCHPVVIETLAKLKSRKRLEDYISKVPPYSKYRRQIGDKLGSKAIAWKDT